ncbi:MAG: phage portal protein [Caldilineales bacterium]|nr:phage portal protein [Caldilineales bacterium]
MTLPLNQAQMERLIYLMAQSSTLTAAWRAVRDYRAYYAGDHPVYLSARQQEYLGHLLTEAEHTVAFNVCRLVVDTLRERIRLLGFESDDEDVQLFLARLWDTAKLDMEQIAVHRRALRDGRSFLIVGWDRTHQLPTLIANRLYDGADGVSCYYDDETGQPLVAIKHWSVSNPLSPQYGQERRTIYLPDRILRQQADTHAEYGWRPLDPAEGPALQYWTSNLAADGTPLGLAVIEFRNPGGVSELEDIIGLQNALNKTTLDLLAAADTLGFPLLTISYPGPPTANSTPTTTDETAADLPIAPGRVTELFEGAEMHALPAGDLSQLLHTLRTIVSAVGAVSRTPQYYLWPTGNWGDDVPSGEALKQLESGLVARAQERTVQFGDAWAAAARMAIRLYNALGVGPTLNAEARITPIWASTEVRNVFTDAQAALMHYELGVPAEILWREKLGYTAEQIAEMKRLKALEQAASLSATLLGVNRVATNVRQPASRPVALGGNGRQPGISGLAGPRTAPASPTDTVARVPGA